MDIFNEEMYRKKKIFFQNRKREEEKFLTRKEDKHRVIIDAKWQGKYWILFISFPKEWLKGSLSGIRYVQDDPYVLYQAALDYVSTQKDLANTYKDTEDQVNDSYDNYIEVRKAYQEARRDLQKDTVALEENEVKNMLGELSDDEYYTFKEEYETLQDALVSAISTYSSTLYSFDRLTCGYLSQYFESATVEVGGAASMGQGKGEGAAEDASGADGAASGLSAIYAFGATYSIRSVADGEEFILYVDIPDDVEELQGITHFELWCDNTQIGSRTAVGDGLRHMTLAKSEVDKCLIRLYRGNEFVSDCEIDPSSSVGNLNVVVGYEEEGTGKTSIGTYETEEQLSSGMIRIKPRPEDVHELTHYTLKTKDDGKYLYDEEKTAVGKDFDYVLLSPTDMKNLEIDFYEDGRLIYEAFFNDDTKELYTDTESYEQRMEELAKRQEEEAQAEVEAERDARLAAKYDAEANEAERLALLSPGGEARGGPLYRGCGAERHRTEGRGQPGLHFPVLRLDL